MAQPIYLPEGNLLTIVSPLVAPQYPLDSGWWSFKLGTVEDDPELLCELRIKNAGNRFEFIASWITSLTGHTVTRENNPAVWQELHEISEGLGTVKLT